MVIVIFSEGIIEGLNEGTSEGIKFELFIMISATIGGRICSNNFYDSWDTIPRISPFKSQLLRPRPGSYFLTHHIHF